LQEQRAAKDLGTRELSYCLRTPAKREEKMNFESQSPERTGSGFASGTIVRPAALGKSEPNRETLRTEKETMENFYLKFDPSRPSFDYLVKARHFCAGLIELKPPLGVLVTLGLGFTLDLHP